MLPVDAYYPDHRLVIESWEQQHDGPVDFFDKPAVMTVSGVHRGIQRGFYDERREQEIPKHGLRLIVIRPHDLAVDPRGRLLRDPGADVATLRLLLARSL